MKIVFNKIVINNFLSFGHAEIDLRDRGYTLIEGVNNNPLDGARSNGSGKSSIFNALCYALTGETIQGLTTNLNNIITNDDMSAELDFNVDTDNLSNVDFNCEPATSADDSLLAIISIAAVISSNETPALAAMEPDFSNAVVI